MLKASLATPTFNAEQHTETIHPEISNGISSQTGAAVKQNLPFRMLRIFLLLIAVFVLLLTLAYALPTESIRQNVQDSISTFETEGLYPSYFFDSFGPNQLDNFTDSIMLNTACFGGGVREAMQLPKYSDEQTQIDMMEAAANGSEANGSYERYWQGYLVLLKPLLMFFNYNEIRALCSTLFFVVIAMTSVVVGKRVGTRYAFALVVSLAFANIVALSVSLQFQGVFWIALLGTIATALLPRTNIKGQLVAPILFLALGMITNFWDFLTVPLVTLGFPLIVYILRRSKESFSTNATVGFSEYFLLIFSWGIGYAATWIAKWVIGSIVLNENIFANVQETAQFRISGNAEYVLNRSEMLINNITSYFSPVVICLLAALLCVIVVLLVFFKRRRIESKTVAIMFISATLPYIWYNALANHSQIHYWMTYRLQTITTFAILCILLYMVESKDVLTSLKRLFKKNFYVASKI